MADKFSMHSEWLTEVADYFHEFQVTQGFYDGPFNTDQKLILIMGEVIEAHEEYRSNDNLKHVYYRDDGKPEGFEFELADVFIRLMDLAGALGIDIGARVAEKHAFNQTRPYKHGRNF